MFGMRQSLGRYGALHGELFERRTTNSVSEVTPGQFESVGVGWAAGTEITWTKLTTNWQLEGAYSMGRSLRWDPNGPIVKTAEPAAAGLYSAALVNGPKGWYMSPYDPGHGVRLHVGGRPASNLFVGLTWRYRSGASMTPLKDVVEDRSGSVFGIEGRSGNARLPVFHRLDIRVERSWENGWGLWSAFLDVSNVYNRTNIFQASYDDTYTQRNEYRMLPVVPSLGIALEF